MMLGPVLALVPVLLQRGVVTVKGQLPGLLLLLLQV
jgi:hypothetical protein